MKTAGPLCSASDVRLPKHAPGSMALEECVLCDGTEALEMGLRPKVAINAKRREGDQSACIFQHTW